MNAHLSTYGYALTGQALQSNLDKNTGSAYLPWSSGVARDEVSLLLADVPPTPKLLDVPLVVETEEERSRESAPPLLLLLPLLPLLPLLLPLPAPSFMMFSLSWRQSLSSS